MENPKTVPMRPSSVSEAPTSFARRGTNIHGVDLAVLLRKETVSAFTAVGKMEGQFICCGEIFPLGGIITQ